MLRRQQSQPTTYEHFRTPFADCKVVKQAVRRFASHDRSTAVCSVSWGVAAPSNEYLPTFRRIMVPFQGTSSPKRMNFLHCLIVKAKALRRFETSGTSGPAKKNGLRGLLDLEVVFFLYLLILTYCLLLLLFSSRILLFLSSSIPSLDLPYVFPSLILSFHFALFSSVFPASLLLSPFLLINYLTPPRVVSGSGAISVLRNVPSSATVISEVVKLTVEFLATLFLLQTTDSRSLAFKAGFLQFLHS